jgi:Na+/proline symporter
MPGATANLGHTWYISTVLMTSLGFCMWPHGFAATFTAKSGDTLRRNAVVMPLYTITLAFIFFVVSVERYRPAARRDCEPALNAPSGDGASTFGEAAYISSPVLNGMMVFVGDPLYRPSYAQSATAP